MTFTYDFFNWAHMEDVITDSHFVTRDRMGRTLVFLARQIRDGRASSALAMAVNEATSVEVDMPVEPKAAERKPLPLIGAIAPLVVGVAMFLLSHNPSFLLFTLLSPVMLVGGYMSDRRQGKKS